MKNKLNKIIIACVSLLCSLVSHGQLAKGMMIHGSFENGVKYVAEITGVKANTFTCSFVQSDSKYSFVLQNDNNGTEFDFRALVTDTKGGKFGKNSIFNFNAYTVQNPISANNDIAVNQAVIVKFGSGKSFLGVAEKSEGNLYVTMSHSGNIYMFDKNNKVGDKSGGIYPKGTQAFIYIAANVKH